MVPFSHPVSRRRRFRSKDIAVTRQLPWASTQRMRRAPVITCREEPPLVRQGASMGVLHRAEEVQTQAVQLSLLILCQLLDGSCPARPGMHNA